MSNNKLTKAINKTEAKKSYLGFGYKDDKGREIGMAAYTWELDVIEYDRPENYFFAADLRMETGHYFVAVAQPTRDSKSFGASQPRKYFKTVQERDAYLARRWKDSLKAAEKKAKQSQ